MTHEKKTSDFISKHDYGSPEFIKEKTRKMKEELTSELNDKYSEEESRFGIRQFREHENPWGYIAEVKRWLETDKQWMKIETLEEFREKMTKSKNYEPRHIKKVEHAINHLKKDGINFE